MGGMVSEGPFPPDTASDNLYQQYARKDQMRKDEEKLAIPALIPFMAGLYAIQYLGGKLGRAYIPPIVEPVKEKIVTHYNDAVDQKITHVKKQQSLAQSNQFQTMSQDTYAVIGRSDKIHIPEMASYSAVIAGEQDRKEIFGRNMNIAALGVEIGATLGLSFWVTYRVAKTAIKHNVPGQISKFFVETFKLYDENKNHFKDYTNGVNPNHFKDYSKPVKPAYRANSAPQV